MNGAKGKGQAWTQVSLGYSRVKACGFFFSLSSRIQGSDVRDVIDVIDWTPLSPLDLSRHDLPGIFWFIIFQVLKVYPFKWHVQRGYVGGQRRKRTKEADEGLDPDGPFSNL